MSFSDASVHRVGRHEALIEAALDLATAYAREGNFERALECLAEAEILAGGVRVRR